MKKTESNFIESTIDKLTNKIIEEVHNINGKDSLKNISAIKKVIDSVDKLVLLKEKLINLKKAESAAIDSRVSEKDNAIIENYLAARLKHMYNEKLKEG